MKSPSQTLFSTLLLGSAVLTLSACSREQTLPEVSGGESGIFALEYLQGGLPTGDTRPSALLGIFVSDYLARGPFAFVQSALSGIAAQTAFAAEDGGLGDEDYLLLQSFADALNVDLISMLNQSLNREEALNKYVEALDNVAERAHGRHAAIGEMEESLRDVQRDQQREVNTLKSELNAAISEQDFSQAGSIQESLDEKQAVLSATQLEVTQLRNIERTFGRLLDAYEERSVAIASNREALIAGITVINVPGAEDLKIIERPDRSTDRGFLVPTFGED